MSSSALMTLADEAGRFAAMKFGVFADHEKTATVLARARQIVQDRLPWSDYAVDRVVIAYMAGRLGHWPPKEQDNDSGSP